MFYHVKQLVDNLVYQFYSNRKQSNTTLNVLACALYGVFKTANLGFPEAFFDYCSSVDNYRSIGPMRLISG